MEEDVAPIAVADAEVTAAGDAIQLPTLAHDIGSVEDKSIMWKVTKYLIPYLWMLYFLSFLDRVNIGNAHGTMVTDLGITEQDYSYGVSIFFIGYVGCEVPSNILMKRFAPHRWLARIMVTWGALSTAMMFVAGVPSLLIIRLLLGAAEAGLFPGIVYYLTFWYPQRERAQMIAYFFSASAAAGAVGGLLAHFILQLDGTYNLRGWQWLFLVEGLPTFFVGFLTWFVLPDYPKDAKWLTPAEAEHVTNRLIVSKGSEATEAVGKAGGLPSFKDVWATLSDPVALMMAGVYFCIVTPFYSIAFFLPSLIKNFGFEAFYSNLLTVPIYTVAFVAVTWNALHSDRTQERMKHTAIPLALNVGGFLLMGLVTGLGSHAVSYAVTAFTTALSFATIPTLLAWLTENLRGALAIGVGTAMVVSIGNIGGVVGPQTMTSSLTRTGGYTTAFVILAVVNGIGAVSAVFLERRLKRAREAEAVAFQVLEETI